MIEFTADQMRLDPLLRYFSYAHLPTPLQGVSREFYGLASFVVGNVPRTAERTVALRKLLEAKDAAVRASVPEPGAKQETFYDRLLAESKELEGRLEKLGEFIRTSPEFAKLPRYQQTLLLDQRAAMTDYSQILGQRIAALTTGTQDQIATGEEIDEGVRVTGGGQSEKPLPFRD